MSTPLVSIIIVNWNGKKWLTSCLASLEKQNYKHFEIILVDNSSTDGSVDYVKRYYPNIKVYINNKNVGFADANNIGYRHAKGTYILFLNNDTKVTINFLTSLVSYMEQNPDVGGAQSKLLLMDKPTIIDAAGAYLTNTGFLNHYGFHEKDDGTFNQAVAVYTVKGACMIFRKNVLSAVAIDNHIFDPSYFAYFEETDLCHRIWLSGYIMMFVPESVVYHKAGGTSTKICNHVIQFHSFKNRIHCYLTNLSFEWLLLMLPIHLAAVQIFAFHALIKGNFSLFLAVEKSILWNIEHISEIMYKRSFVRNKIQRIKDKNILPLIVKNRNIQYYVSLMQHMSMYQK